MQMEIKEKSMDAEFQFNATVFVQPGYETVKGDWSEADLGAIQRLRKLYPELDHWGDFAMGIAFGDWSQEFFLVSWADWMTLTRDELFLNFCYWRQTRGAWKHGFDEQTLSTASGWSSAVKPH